MTFSPFFWQSFDKDGDGVVNKSDISHVLPVSKLPKAQLPQQQVRRRKISGRGNGEETSLHGNQVPANMDFGMSSWKVMHL